MTISPTLKRYLEDRDIDFELVSHSREVVSSRIAERAHIHGAHLAKGVLLNADSGFKLAVVPATRRVDLARLSHLMDERLGLATDEDVMEIFRDCDFGAVPACGTAYGMKVIIDSNLDDAEDLYFEAGDHENLVHLSHREFCRMMPDMPHAQISAPAQ